MIMLKKIKNLFLSLLYGLLYGMKSGENELLTTKSSSMTDTNIQENINESNVGGDMMRGEVTQEVQDLRYSTYKVYNESKNYQYIGEGQAIKMNKREVGDNYSFSQSNQYFCDGVYEALCQNPNTVDKFTLSILYHDVSRFRVERFVEMFYVLVKNGECIITLRFNYDFDKTQPLSRMFYNELKRVAINGNEKTLFTSNIKGLSFTTYKAQGEDDLVMYILDDVTLKAIESQDTYVNIIFSTTKFIREDLTEKFYSLNQQKKYDNKESKEQPQKLQITTIQHKYSCTECGAEMNKYDYDITKYDLGRALCIKCLEKYLTNEVI